MSTRRQPRVSIGLPVHNGGRYLAAALDSLLEQDFGDFELIISDNASTDDTAEICAAYARKDRRVSFFRNAENIGAAGNYNRVFDLARGEFFKWATHDDICERSYLRRCVEMFDQSPRTVVLCYPKTVLIDERGEVLRPYEDRLDLRFASACRRLRHLLRYLVLCNAVVGLIRRDVLAATRRIAPFAASDTVLLTELALRGSFREIPERLYFRRVHAEASMHANANASAVTAWYDPALRGRIVFKRTRLLVENARVILRAPLPWLDKLDCLQVLCEERIAAQGQWRVLGREWKLGLKRYLSRWGDEAGMPPARNGRSKRRSQRGLPAPVSTGQTPTP